MTIRTSSGKRQNLLKKQMMQEKLQSSLQTKRVQRSLDCRYESQSRRSLSTCIDHSITGMPHKAACGESECIDCSIAGMQHKDPLDNALCQIGLSQIDHIAHWRRQIPAFSSMYWGFTRSKGQKSVVKETEGGVQKLDRAECLQGKAGAEEIASFQACHAEIISER